MFLSHNVLLFSTLIAVTLSTQLNTSLEKNELKQTRESVGMQHIEMLNDIKEILPEIRERFSVSNDSQMRHYGPGNHYLPVGAISFSVSLKSCCKNVLTSIDDCEDLVEATVDKIQTNTAIIKIQQERIKTVTLTNKSLLQRLIENFDYVLSTIKSQVTSDTLAVTTIGSILASIQESLTPAK